MDQRLRAQVISGVGWRAVERYSVQLVRFFVGVILARLLGPRDFGLIALVMVFVDFGRVLIDGGFRDALVQTERVDDSLYSSVFLCNVAIGICCAVLLAVSAPFVAAFYGTPELRYIVPALSLNLWISSAGVVYTAILVKRLRFKSLAKISIVSTITSGAMGLLMALNGYGVWSLVGQTLTVQLVELLGLRYCSAWQPQCHFESDAIKEVAPFSVRVFVATITESLFVSLNVVLIGKVFSPTTLGLYSRADSIWSMTMANLASVLSSVALPVFSAIKNSPGRLTRAMKSAVEMLAFVSYPAAIGVVAIAHPLVLVLLGKRWEPCVPFLQLLGGVWVLYPMLAINGSVLLALGQSRSYLRLQLTKKAIALAAFPLLAFGVIPFILGQTAVGFAGYYLTCRSSGRLTGYPMSAQLRDSLPYMTCAMLMGACVQAAGAIPVSHRVVELIFKVGLGAFSYLTLCWLFRLPALGRAVELVSVRWPLRVVSS